MYCDVRVNHVVELTEHYAYRYPDSLRHTCMECGHQWNITDAGKKDKHLTCPHCGRRLEAKDARRDYELLGFVRIKLFD